MFTSVLTNLFIFPLACMLTSVFMFSDTVSQNIAVLIADSDADEQKSWNLLGDCLKEMTSLIAAALFERLLILTAQSIRALLTVCGEMEEVIFGESSQAQHDFSSVLVHSIRYLHVYCCSLSRHSSHFTRHKICSHEMNET